MRGGASGRAPAYLSLIAIFISGICSKGTPARKSRAIAQAMRDQMGERSRSSDFIARMIQRSPRSCNRGPSFAAVLAPQRQDRSRGFPRALAVHRLAGASSLGGATRIRTWVRGLMSPLCSTAALQRGPIIRPSRLSY